MKHLLLILSLMIAGNAWGQTLTTQNGTTTLGGAALTGAAITNNYASGNAAIVLSNNVTVDATHTITAGGFIGNGGAGTLILSNAANTDYTVFEGAPSNSYNLPVIFRSTETNTTMGAGVIHSTSAGGRTSSAVVETDLTLADNTTANASTSAHGFVKKLPNDATKYYDGTGNYTVPVGGGGGTSVTNCTFVMTNFVLNTVYTNLSGAIQEASASAALVTGVGGQASMDLYADQAGGTTFVLLKRVGISGLANGNATNDISGCFSNNATYYFTNTSTGAGDSSSLLAGTGQLKTIGGSGTLKTIAGPAGYTWTTSGSTATATTPSEVLTNGATQSIALGGGLTNNSAAGFNGNGAGLTNNFSWSLQGFTPSSTLTASRTYYPGNIFDVATADPATTRGQHTVMRAGTVSAVNVHLYIGGTLDSSADSATLYVTNITQATSASCGTILLNAAISDTLTTGLSLAVSSGDKLIVGLVTPASFGATPTNVRIATELLFKY